jgi:hypothetical protein
MKVPGEKRVGLNIKHVTGVGISEYAGDSKLY